jgi:hypothetical protein
MRAVAISKTRNDNTEVIKFLRRVKSKISSLRPVVIFSAFKRISQLPDFPSSPASLTQYFDLTLLGARNTYSELNRLAKVGIEDPIPSIEDFAINNVNQTQQYHPSDLSKLFSQHGSDKSTEHNYEIVYSKIISSLLNGSERLSLLEIGLGSNNTDTPSNMGTQGRPGASLRAWRDLDFRINVVGADIDKRVLFEEERISTFQLDQTSHQSWAEFKRNTDNQFFDLIIDDGLHSPYANLVTVNEALSMLSPNGLIVVEDIHERSIPVWKLAQLLLPNSFESKLYKARRAYILVISRR